MAKKTPLEIDAAKLDNLIPKEISARFFYDRDNRELCVVSELKPCDYRPLEDAVVFSYDPKVEDNCLNVQKADSYLSIWINDLNEKATDLQAPDLNNLACVHLWRKDGPDWQKAKSFFSEAHEKAPKNKTIEENRRKIANALNTPSVSRILNVSLEAVQKLAEVAGKVEVLTAKEFKNLRLSE